MHRALRLVLVASCLPPCLSAAAQSEPLSPADRVKQYAPVRLTADLSGLTAKQRQMIPLLFAAAEQMDEAFWLQAYGDRSRLLASIEDQDVLKLVRVNYGPWDRLADNQPFVAGVGPKPAGANFYPSDMSKEEFERAAQASPDREAALRSLYTVVRRDAQGRLKTIPYHEFFARQTAKAAEHLLAAAELAENAELQTYLRARSQALLSSDYRASDLAWMDMKSNTLDIVIGPIETYEDQLFGYKAAHEAYVLVKDQQWSRRLSRYATLLPELQAQLPVPDQYKQEKPGTKSDLNAYDVIYYAGDCNAGAKTIAINLPNDEQVQLSKGTRRLQLKNAMRAKFDKILLPISEVLIAEDQRHHVTFDAFFGNTMFHEVAHGLGIKNTITGRGTVRSALRERSSALEEGKADILGLYMVTRLREQNLIEEGELMDSYVTFLASIFRSVRFGASSAHGRANMLRFNFFAEHQAFERSPDGTYRVRPDNMRKAMTLLSQRILQLQGDGDYAAAGRFVDQYGGIRPDLQADLERLSREGIPVDVVFEQGLSLLGLE